MAVARFMASPTGRGGRIALGLGLIAWGTGVIGQGPAWLAVAGLLPVTLGVINACLAGPLMKLPFWGCELGGRP